MNIAVIGAGASGMAAALQAAWGGAQVTLFERNESAGKKLLVTGSGRCNITNDAIAAGAYACSDTRWMEILLARFGVAELKAMLLEAGIPVRATFDGWYYPLSESAHTVVDAFVSALRLAGVTLVTNAQVLSVKPGGGGFTLRYCQGDVEERLDFNRVIVSAGGKAYPSLGSRGELFPMLESLGHTVLPLRPALAPVLADLGNLKQLQGMRFDVEASVYEGKEKLAASRGNVIFTEWGLNGPAVMNISHEISARPGGGLELSLDFLAYFQDEFDSLLAQKRDSDLPLGVFLEAFFPPKAAAGFIWNAGLGAGTSLKQLNGPAVNHLSASLQNTRLKVTGVRGFEYCQVSAGGVPVTEVGPNTLESLRIKGLYLTGETLDVVGPCGGFNLHYAFSSGALAGQAAAR
jgi:predicted Rossmann fold flavoprotein